MAIIPDFSREVYCLLGLPFDAVNLVSAEQQVRTAASERSSFHLSTPNVNFLIAAQSDCKFRNSVISSDLCIADGMPLVWIAKFIGVPIRERVAGSDLFNKLRKGRDRFSVYFFGGIEGVAESACLRLNSENSSLTCVGFESPGFAPIQEISRDESIERINASGADFLVVSLGAKKGQAWIEHNRSRISVPVISHLGAVINFISEKIDRAPVWMQRSGLEWIWRIKEEPALWRRYISDGWVFIKLFITHILPYAWFMYLNKPAVQQLDSTTIQMIKENGEIVIRLSGAWVRDNLMPFRECLTSTARAGMDVRIELENVSYIDSAFIGLLILLYGNLKRQGKRLSFRIVTEKLRRIFRYSCAEYLLNTR